MFMALVMLDLLIIVGWLFMYKQHLADTSITESEPKKMKWFFYKLLVKEGYFFSLFKFLKKVKI
jgi:hypothetical protein